MSHIKNVQSLEKLLGICTGFGESYQPGKQKLQVEAMAALVSQAQQCLREVAAARAVYNSATNSRALVFDSLGPLRPRLIGALIASGVPQTTVDDARALVRKLSRQRAADRNPIPSETTSKLRRARGLDYVSLVGHFEDLLMTLSEAEGYDPKQEDLVLSALEENLIAIRASNSRVADAAHELYNARSNRDNLLYRQPDSVYNVVRMAKEFVKSVYGFNSDQYRAVSKLKFTKGKA